MSIIRIGSNEKYADGWDKAFGKGKKKSVTSAKSSASKKMATKKKSPAKKKSAKKKA